MEQILNVNNVFQGVNHVPMENSAKPVKLPQLKEKEINVNVLSDILITEFQESAKFVTINVDLVQDHLITVPLVLTQPDKKEVVTVQVSCGKKELLSVKKVVSITLVLMTMEIKNVKLVMLNVTLVKGNPTTVNLVLLEQVDQTTTLPVDVKRGTMTMEKNTVNNVLFSVKLALMVIIVILV